MKKQIFSIGYEIPGKSDCSINFSDTFSLMDADVLLISPDSLRPWGDWVSFTPSDGGCYNVEASNRYIEKMTRLKKELKDHLKAGKNVFIFLTQEQEEYLASSVSSPRKGQNTYNTQIYSNYNFLPIDIGTLTSASGKHVQFLGKSIFSSFYNKFKKNLKYELYIEYPKDAQIIFTGKDKTKILGAIYKAGLGHLVTLPVLTFNEKDFTETKEEDDGATEEFWNKKGITFGDNFVRCLLEIDEQLTDNSGKTPTPEWASKEQFSGNKEKKLCDSINKNDEKIIKILKATEKLKKELEEETKLKDLLF